MTFMEKPIELTWLIKNIGVIAIRNTGGGYAVDAGKLERNKAANSRPWRVKRLTVKGRS